MAQKEHSNQFFIFYVIIFICFAITLYFLSTINNDELFQKLQILLIFNVSIYIIMNIFIKNHKRLLNLTGFYTAWVFISPALIYYITQNSVDMQDYLAGPKVKQD